jgi:replicative DNA helicase
MNLVNYRIKDEIINFVQNSSEEVNTKVSIFIAGMQAQKSLMNCRSKKTKACLKKHKKDLSVSKIIR